MPFNKPKACSLNVSTGIKRHIMTKQVPDQHTAFGADYFEEALERPDYAEATE